MNSDSLLSAFRLFRVKREERPLATVMLLVFLALDALVICKYYDVFTPQNAHYWHLFISKFHISGFDPITYSVVSNWTAGYNVYRHPLLAFFMYVPYLINQGLMWLTGINCAIFIVSAILLFAAFYSMIFLYRICREVVGVSRTDSTLATVFYFGFAFVMLSTMVPDHFALSLPLLLLTLLIAGRRLKEDKPMKLWQSALLFFLTAGMTLTNGVKVALAAWFAGGRKVFSWRSILSFVVPTLLLGAVYLWQKEAIIAPQERNIKRIEAAVAKKDPARIAKLKEHDDFVKQQNGEALTKSVPLLEWSDMTTSRWQSAVDNLFGESLQLHRDYLLEDVQQTRPVFVEYRSAVNYIVEALVVLLLVAGAWIARREKFFLMVFSWFAFDMIMHMGFGFGLNEVYIMTAHWAFIIPIAAGYILRRKNSMAARVLVAALTLWLWAYNAVIVIGYL